MKLKQAKKYLSQILVAAIVMNTINFTGFTKLSFASSENENNMNVATSSDATVATASDADVATTSNADVATTSNAMIATRSEATKVVNVKITDNQRRYTGGIFGNEQKGV